MKINGVNISGITKCIVKTNTSESVWEESGKTTNSRRWLSVIRSGTGVPYATAVRSHEKMKDFFNWVVAHPERYHHWIHNETFNVRVISDE